MSYWYITGIYSSAQYLNNRVDTFSLSQKVDNLVKRDEKILMVFDMKMGFIENNYRNTFVELFFERFFNQEINQTPRDVYELLKKENIKYIIYNFTFEDMMKNFPYYSLNLDILESKSYKSYLERINLFHQFKNEYLKEIDCMKRYACLYAVI